MKKKPYPKRIHITWVDPWTGEFLAGIDMAFTKQRAAMSHYSRTAKRLKTVAMQWAGARRPHLLIVKT